MENTYVDDRERHMLPLQQAPAPSKGSCMDFFKKHKLLVIIIIVIIIFLIWWFCIRKGNKSGSSNGKLDITRSH